MKKSRKKQNKTEKTNAQSKRNVTPLDLEPPKRYYFNDEVASSFSGNRAAPQKKYNKNDIRKKQNKKRKLKRGVRNFLITAGVVIAIAVIAVVLSLTVFFNISAISISGSGTYSEEQIEQLCDINIGDNMFLVDENKCREKLTTGLPYIYDVKISRKLPDTIKISITEAEPAYIILNDDKTYTILDDQLKVLENDAKEKAQGAVTIKNAIPVSNTAGQTIEFENEETLACIKSIVDAIKTVQLDDVSVISSTDKNNNSVLYKNRITFVLGNCQNLENKLYKALAACEELDKRNDKIKGRLNVSDESRIYFVHN